jgi:Protein kinase domain
VSPTFLQVSQIVGRYQLLQKLGEGGMADVYLARQLDLDRLVAMKELRVLGGSDPAFAKRFLREARMAGSLSHPNIVTVHDYIESNGTPFIAMEYMDRGSLRPLIGRMTLPQIGVTLEAILAALDYAGGRGIVHRDMKPENVMLSSEGRVKIADFGIAKARNAFQTSGSLTAEGTALGTPNYMAPEQASAEEVGPSTDIYAVGVMAFEMFVGHPPFADTPQPLVLIMRQVRDPIPRVTDLDPTIDPRIAEWISWLTAKDPSQRPQTAGQAWDHFEEILVSTDGPRWRRAGVLLPLVPVATQAAAAGVAAASTFMASTPSTQALEDPRLVPTMPANPDLLGIDRTEPVGAGANGSDGSKRRRRRRGGAVLAAVAAAAAVVLLAGAALKRDASPVRAADRTPPATTTPAAARDASTPTTSATTTPSAAPTGSSGAAAGADNSALKSQGDASRTLAHQYNAAAAKIEGLHASGAQADQNAILADLLRKTASAYGRAGRAADRGDAQGYASAMADANATKAQLQQATQNPLPSGSSGGGSSNSSGGGGSSSSCAGDSQSDDPSDDSCGGEP